MNLSSLAIRKPIFLTSVVVVTLLVGFLCLEKLGVDNFPDVTFPVVVATITYSGASPEEVETLISKPVEEELSSTSGLKRLSSTNQEGLALIVAEFTLGTDVKYAEQQIRDKVSKVRSKLPKDIDEPVIDRVDVDDQPIMEFSVSGDLSPAQLYDVAENDVKPQLEQTDNVGKVDIIGGTKREIKVEVDRARLRAHDISIQKLATQIGASAQNVPVGKIDSGKNETVFRTIGEYKTIDQIKHTVVNFFGGDVPVSVGQIATVRDSVEDEKSRGYLEGKPALFLQVHKQSGTNTVSAAEALVKRMGTINKMLQQKPGNLKLGLVRDGAKYIRANVEDVKSSILLGVFLAVIVVFLFLGNVRSTIITGLALPNSLLGAFILMYVMGFTINVMTLLALSLAVGLLIDDAIVVRENIFRRLEEGESARDAAEHGTREVTLAVIATTLTVIAVFLPVGFLQGTVGQFFKQFGLTIVFAMAISLFDALTMAPMLSAYFAGNMHAEPKGLGKILALFSGAVDALQNFLSRIYERVLKFSLDRPAVVLSISVMIFLFSLGLAKHIKATFLPNTDNGEFSVNLEMPPGTSLDAMEQVSKKVETTLRSFPEIDKIALTVGDADGVSNVASFYVSLVNYKLRSIMTNDLKALIREKLKPFSYALPKVSDLNIVGGAQQAFNVNLTGENLDELSKYSSRIFEKIRKINGLVDVDTNFRLGKPEFQVRISPELAQRYGVLTVSAGQELRGLMDGITPAKFRENGREYDIRVRLLADQRDLQKYFETTYVPNINNNLVRLKDISKGVSTQGPAKISRLNRSRTIKISGDIGVGGAIGNIRTETEKIIQDEKLPPGISYSFQGQAEDFQDLMINMLIAVCLAVIFVFLILSSLYESFVTPFTIMLALPLAVAGAFIALFVTHQTLNIFSMIGMIMLLGLVTKNSILLVDYALQLMHKGKSRKDALMESGLKRLRPILMTTVALIAGTLPVALGLSEAARSRTSMGIAIIGGLISSTLLTLIVVPAAFGFIDDFRMWCARILGNIFIAKEEREVSKTSSIESAGK